MPELPEVETFARSLSAGGMTGSSILNRPFCDAALYWERTLAAQDAGDFRAWFRGRSVESVGRRGKYLKLRIDDRWLLIHLRMSGDIRTVAADQPVGPHDRFSLTFRDGERLVFSDPRKFGRIWLIRDPETVLAKLGIEPLSDALTAEFLRRAFETTRRPVKSVLLDQSLIAGLGNIYTDEALFRAGIHPLTPAERAARMDDGRLEALRTAIRSVLIEGIRNNGASIDWVYHGGGFQNHFSVYGKKGDACPRCGAVIARIVVGQRGTHFCPRCQPLPTEIKSAR